MREPGELFLMCEPKLWINMRLSNVYADETGHAVLSCDLHMCKVQSCNKVVFVQTFLKPFLYVHEITCLRE